MPLRFISQVKVMNEKTPEQIYALFETYMADPDVKVARGHMRVEFTRGDIVEVREPAILKLGVEEDFTFIRAYIMEYPQDWKDVLLLSTVKLEAGKSYELKSSGTSEVVVFYTIHKDGSEHQFLGDGILKVTEFLDSPTKPYVKGTVEFMSHERPGDVMLVKVFAKDFWVEGDVS